MKPKHTPGPWKSLDDEVVSAGGQSIARMMVPYTLKSKTSGFSEAKIIERNHNCQLISIAPEMFDLLKEIRSEISRVNDAAGETVFNPTATSILDSLVAKIEGQS